MNRKIERIEKKTSEPDFWNRENSQEILKELNVLKKLIEEYEKINEMNEDVSVMIEFIEAGDSSFEKELDDKIDTVMEEIQNFKIKLLLDRNALKNVRQMVKSERF